MEDIDTQDHRSRMGSYPQYSSQPPVARIPTHDNITPYPPPPAGHAPPKYEPSPSPYQSGPPDNRHYSEGPPHTPVSAHPGFGLQREPGQYPPEGPYSRSGSISAPTRSPSEAHQIHYRPPNGNPHEHLPPGPVDYRDRQPYPPPQHYPPNGAIAHGMPGPEMPEGMHGPPPGMTPVAYAPTPGSAGPYDPYGASYGNPYGKRRPVRATQVCLIQKHLELWG
jgi:hypothetical protein